MEDSKHQSLIELKFHGFEESIKTSLWNFFTDSRFSDVYLSSKDGERIGASLGTNFNSSFLLTLRHSACLSQNCSSSDEWILQRELLFVFCNHVLNATNSICFTETVLCDFSERAASKSHRFTDNFN